MTCTNCRRENLPGGLRCAYCGTYLPTDAAFDLSRDAALNGESAEEKGEPIAAPTDSPNRGGVGARAIGMLTTLGVLALKAKSLLTLLSLGKLALTFGSMFIFIAAEARLYGWKLGAGLAICIFIHEMGHVVVNWSKGLKQSAPMFIPFVGAVIFIKRFPNNPTVQSESGAGGPIAGGLAALICLGIGAATGESFWYSLAFLGFAINLFNLIPFPPLDGSHIASVFSPRLWNLIIVVMVLVVLKATSLLILWMLIAVGVAMRLMHGGETRYLMAAPAVRARMAAIYLTLAIVLSWGAAHTAFYRPKPQVAATATSATAHEVAAEAKNAPAPKAAPRTKKSDEESPLDPLEKDKDDLNFGIPPNLTLILGIGGFFLLTATLLICWGTVNLLRGASGRRWAGKDFALLGVLFLLPAAALFLSGFFVSGLTKDWFVLGAAYAAIGLAFAYAIFAAVTEGKNRYARMAPVRLRSRALAFAAGGAALVAYGANSVTTALALIFVLVVYYLRRPYRLIAVGAEIADAVGDEERALKLLTRAAERCKDPEEAAGLWQLVAERNLNLDRGDEALTARYNRDRGTQQAASSEFALFDPLPDAVAGIAAQGLATRYPDALADCERLLQIASRDPRRAALGPFFVHNALARLSLFRGWYDEAQVQAEWCLQVLSPNAKSLVAELHALRAEALTGLAEQAQDAVRQKFLTAARAATEKALESSREPNIQAWIAAIHAHIALLAGDAETAATEANRAASLLPGHLGCRYWKARIVTKEDLPALAAEFPNDYWGKRASLSASADA